MTDTEKEMGNAAYDIITLGSATIDYFADTDSELIRIDTRTTHEELLAFPLGSKILIKELNTTIGGGGTNTAVAFSRLGLRTAWLGKLGEDPNGDYVLSSLAAEKVDFIGYRGGQTGVSLVLNSIRDDRTILTYKGANNTLSKSLMPELLSPWLYISSMIGDSWQAVLDYVEATTSKLVFNPSSYQAAMGYDQLRVLTDRVSILVMNVEEACLYLGLDPHQQHQGESLAQALCKVPGQTTIVTGGAGGACVCVDGMIYSGTPRAGIRIIEATGAGDAFASTYTASHLRGLGPEQALHYAMTNAESVLQHKGAKEKLLSWPELETIANSQTRPIRSQPCQPS